jgi:hypothetical protein
MTTYPVVFDGRILPLPICDEFVKMWSDGSAGEALPLR